MPDTMELYRWFQCPFSVRVWCLCLVLPATLGMTRIEKNELRFVYFSKSDTFSHFLCGLDEEGWLISGSGSVADKNGQSERR